MTQSFPYKPSHDFSPFTPSERPQVGPDLDAEFAAVSLASQLSVPYVDTLEDIRHLDPIVQSWPIVKARAHCVLGQGGDGDFVWMPASLLDDDDGIVLHPVSIGSGSPGRFQRLFSGSVRASFYGPPSYAGLQAASAASKRLKTFIELETGLYNLTDFVSIEGEPGFETRSGLRGEGPARTIVRQRTSNKPALVMNGRFMELRGLSIEHLNKQGYADVDGACLLVQDMLMVSEIRNLWIKEGYYGIECRGSGNGASFNCTWDAIRVTGWYKAAFHFGNSSGSLRLNLYAAATSRDSVDHALITNEFSGEFKRLNLEHTVFRKAMIDVQQPADNISIYGLHNERNSYIAEHVTALHVETLAAAFFNTSGRGVQKVEQWTIDSCHVGGWPVVTDSDGTIRLTYDAGSGLCTAELDLMQFLTRMADGNGHGIRVGDSIFVEGADQAEYNGSFVVSAIKVPASGDGVARLSYVPGSPPGVTPATVASGCDVVTINLGDQVLNSVNLVNASLRAGLFVIDGLTLRDMRVIGKDAARRSTMLRVLGSDSGGSGSVTIRNLRFGNQTNSASYWHEVGKVAGYRRVSNVATVWFQRPHQIRSTTNSIYLTGCTDTSFNGKTGALTPISDYAVSFADTGSDKPLTRDAAAKGLLETYSVTTIERANGIAILTLSGDHTLENMARIAVVTTGSGFNTDNALVLFRPATNQLAYRNAGSDTGPSSVTGSVMVIEGCLSTGSLEEGTPVVGVLSADWLDHYSEIIKPGTINAGATSPAALVVQRAKKGRHIVVEKGRIFPQSGDARDPALVYWSDITADNEVTHYVHNPTGSPIDADPFEFRFEIGR